MTKLLELCGVGLDGIRFMGLPRAPMSLFGIEQQRDEPQQQRVLGPLLYRLLQFQDYNQGLANLFATMATFIFCQWAPVIPAQQARK